MTDTAEYHDYLIEVGNPKAFDETIQQLGPAVLMQDGVGMGREPTYVQHEGHYVMRVLGSPGFVLFVIENQGYGKVLSELVPPL